MIRINNISYTVNGKVKRLNTNILLNENIKKQYIPAEFKVAEVKYTSPFLKYKRKDKMPDPKCRCSKCHKLVDRWINDVCIPCYDEAIIAPYKKQFNDLNKAFIESNKIWSKVVYSYRNRKLVRLGAFFSRLYSIIAYLTRSLLTVFYFACRGLTNDIKRLLPKRTKQ